MTFAVPLNFPKNKFDGASLVYPLLTKSYNCNFMDITHHSEINKMGY